MKSDILDSFLFHSIDIFYPNGVPTDPEQLPNLTPQQVNEIKKTFAFTVDILKELHTEQQEVLSRTFERPIPTDLKTQITICSHNDDSFCPSCSDNNAPCSHIDTQGTVFINVKVAQAIYRTALLSGLKKGEIGGFMQAFIQNATGLKTEEKSIKPITKNENVESIENFLKLKQQIVSTPGHIMLGDFVDMLNNTDLLKSNFQKISGLKMISFMVENHYIGPIQFLLAHELGHSALGHLERQKTADIDCKTLQEFELEADVYAILLLYLGTANNDQIVADIADLSGIKARLGFDDFFKYTYKLSGFKKNEETNCEQNKASKPCCPYPNEEDRKKNIETIYNALLGIQTEKLLKKLIKQKNDNKQ